MPIYDYRCDRCSAVYDVFHKVREVTDDIVCPSCGSQEHTRLLSAPNVSIGARVRADSSSSAGGCSTDGGGCCGGSCGLN
jgi:putative FmdB family regulatory protein